MPYRMNTALTILLVFNIFTASYAGEQRRSKEFVSTIFDQNEELTYSVSWMSINIGTITMTIDSGIGNIRSASAVIDSRDGIPFANVHAVFKGAMSNLGIPVWFIGFDKSKDGEWNVLRYDYAIEEGRAFIRSGSAQSPAVNQLHLTASDTVPIDRMTQDGLSVFYFGRKQVTSRDTFSVTTIVQGIAGTTVMNCSGKRTSTEINAVDYPIDVIEMDGLAKFKGVFGLSGEFTGWFSNDHARVPIRAKLGVILGNVNLELVRWKRSGWIPPRFENDITSN